MFVQWKTWKQGVKLHYVYCARAGLKRKMLCYVATSWWSPMNFSGVSEQGEYINNTVWFWRTVVDTRTDKACLDYRAFILGTRRKYLKLSSTKTKKERNKKQTKNFIVLKKACKAVCAQCYKLPLSTALTWWLQRQAREDICFSPGISVSRPGLYKNHSFSQQG